jgi:hypothetical protein
MIDHEVRAEDDLGEKIGPRIKVDGKDSHTIVPAQPGFSTVSRLVEGGKTLGLIYQPVIAWLVTVEVWQEKKPEGEAERMCFPTPITAVGGQGDGYRSWKPIRLPDGKFEFPDSVIVDSESAAIEYLEEQHAEEEMGSFPAHKIN